MKRKALAALAVVGIIAAGVLFWEIVAFLMWMAYFAGIPM
jgi:hypothetical protein